MPPSWSSGPCIPKRPEQGNTLETSEARRAPGAEGAALADGGPRLPASALPRDTLRGAGPTCGLLLASRRWPGAETLPCCLEDAGCRPGPETGHSPGTPVGLRALDGPPRATSKETDLSSASVGSLETAVASW